MILLFFVLSCYFGGFHFHSIQSLITDDMVKFQFTILAPIPKLNQVFLSPFYSGSNPFVMLIGCTGINFQQIISSCPNKISRITEFLVHVISLWSERSFPLSVCYICYILPSLLAHTCSSLHNTLLTPLTGRCHQLSAQICFSWLLVARELTREPLCSKWCDKW